MIDLLTQKIQKFMAANYHFDFIVPIPRGGLIPSVYLSHRLDIPIDMGFTFPSRSSIMAAPPILIVEDVADTGKMLQSLCGSLREKDKVATLVLKPTSVFKTDFFAAQYEDWIQWPWEICE